MFSETLMALMIMLSSVRTQTVTPSQYVTIQAEGVPSANGSSTTGNCSDVAFSSDVEAGLNVTTCTAPSSSVLFDEIIPTLTGLDGNMWASQLLTLYAPNRVASINFDFSNIAGYAGVNAVEVAIVNCQNIGITVEEIEATTPTTPTSPSATPLARGKPLNTSCNSVIMVQISCHCNKTVLGLQFHTISSNLVYIGEIRFYNSSFYPIVTTDESVTQISTVDSTNVPITSITQSGITTLIPDLPKTTTSYAPTISSSTRPPSLVMDITTSIFTNDNNLMNIILPVVFTIVIILVCVVGVVILLWRCYCAKHNYKFDKTIIMKSAQKPNENAHNKEILPLARRCKEVVPESSASDTTYSTVNDIPKTTYSTDNDMLPEPSQMISFANKTVSLCGCRLEQELYTQVNKKKNNGRTSEANVAGDQLYAHIDKKKATSEADCIVNQLYAQVKKKSSEDNKMSGSDSGTTADQPNIEFDQLEASDSLAMEQEPVYSVVKKPTAPPIPQKSVLLMEEMDKEFS